MATRTAVRALSPRPGAGAYLSVLGAALLWGTLGVSYDLILRSGEVDPITLVWIRMTTAAVILTGYVALRSPSALRVPRAALPTLLAIGAVSFALFYATLAYAFRWSNVPVATVLLYTAPVWVTAGEVLFLGYPLTRKAATAVGLALLGSVLVSGVLGGASGPVSALGVAAGVLSAVAYGSYSVLAKQALHQVPALVTAAYGTAIGAALLLAAKLALSGLAVPPPHTVAAIVLWPGIGITVLPVALYTVGLRALRPSTASVLATLEPVVAIVLAALVLGQRLGPVQSLGAALILASVLYTLARPSRETPSPPRSAAAGSAPSHSKGTSD